MNVLCNRWLGVLLFMLLAVALVSCGGSSGSNSQATGTLELSLTDDAADTYSAVYVTIAEIQVKMQDAPEGESGWVTVVTPNLTQDLLELTNGALAGLGIGELEAGQYGQIRLILGDQPDETTNILGESHPFANYIILSGDDSTRELKVPSGSQSGIKIIHGFTIVAAGTTELILDFDADRSVVQAGNSGQWLLKPVIKILESVENSAGGTVADEAETPLAGVLVSAQLFYPGVVDPWDEVSVAATTVTDAEGTYLIYLVPDIYNIVATADGYLASCQEVEAQFYQNYAVDLSLAAATETISLSGSVSGLAGPEDSAQLSIRKGADCGSGEVMIEVASVNVVNDATFGDIVLPAGAYDVVVTADGMETQVFADIDETTALDIVFGL